MDALQGPRLAQAGNALLEAQRRAAQRGVGQALDAAHVAHAEGQPRRAQRHGAAALGGARRRPEGSEAAVQRGIELVEQHAEDAAVALLGRHAAVDLQPLGEDDGGACLGALRLPRHLALAVALGLGPLLHPGQHQEGAGDGLGAGMRARQLLGRLGLALAALADQRADLGQRDAQQQRERHQREHLDECGVAKRLDHLGCPLRECDGSRWLPRRPKRV